MWGSANPKYKRRLNIISFLVLPVLMVAGLIVGAWLARLLNFRTDSTAIMFVLVGSVPLYLICVRAMYAKAKEKSIEDDDEDKEA